MAGRPGLRSTAKDVPFQAHGGMVDTRSRRKRPTSIRTQITALLWIAVLPLAALHVRSTYETYQRTLAKSLARTLGLAEAAATGTEQLLAMAEAQMLNVARRDALRGRASRAK